MTGEEVAGPPGPKVLRLLYFAGAGLIFTVGINKWRELEKKSAQRQQGIHQEEKILTSVNAAPKPIK